MIVSIKEVLRRYVSAVYRGHSSLLSFAYEQEWDENKSVVKSAMNNTKETEILVISGYSLPDFNSEIDVQLIENINRLEKIYIQDLNPEKIEARLKQYFLVGNYKLILIDDCESLYIPTELLLPLRNIGT